MLSPEVDLYCTDSDRGLSVLSSTARTVTVCGEFQVPAVKVNDSLPVKAVALSGPSSSSPAGVVTITVTSSEGCVASATVKTAVFDASPSATVLSEVCVVTTAAVCA